MRSDRAIWSSSSKWNILSLLLMWGEEEDVPSLQKKQSIKYQVSIERSVNNESLSKEKKLAVPSSSSSPPRKLPVQMKSENQTRVIGDYVHVRKTSLGTSQSNDKEVSLSSTFVSQVTIGSKIEIQKPSPPRLTERSMAQVAMLLRPSSAPLVLGGPRPIIFVVSKVQIAPLLARSMSAIGRFSLPLAFHILLLLPQEHSHFLFFLTRFHFFFFLTSVSICSSSSPALEFLLLLLHPTLQFPLGVHLASLFGFPMAPWSSFPCAFLVFFFRGIAICSDVELHALRRHLQIMVRTRGLGRALGRVSGRGLGREDRDDSDDAPQRRRPTASAHKQRVPVTIADAELVVPVVEADVAAIEADVAATEADVATAEAEVVVDESMVEADVHDIGADIAANASAQAAADEPEGFLGGSTDPSVLTEYAEDVAANECLELKLSFHGRKVHNLGRLVPAIEGLVAGTRLSPLIACSVDNDDRGLLSSFVEWWHWEPSSFHLLVGEVMITLDDVSSLLHLPVVGDLHTFQPLHVDEALQLVRIFSIFWVALIFANKSVTHVHVVFLDALCDLSQTGRYAWGVAALVHMYDHLNDACISTSRQLASYITMLQCLIYEHFLSVAECNADPDYDKDSPHAYRWIATKKTMKNISTGTYRQH
ncbi:Protein MAIN-LIKE 2 [Glycine soja]|uniref:Protein MAIN-LIKE 2 n=1 Tax=Glycine soja TaxID=3848 RepID=A0A445GX11_GLYSO|nr:Protein MAIN-LIKE 2 [Glycine soja]